MPSKRVDPDAALHRPPVRAISGLFPAHDIIRVVLITRDVDRLHQHARDEGLSPDLWMGAQLYDLGVRRARWHTVPTRTDPNTNVSFLLVWRAPDCEHSLAGLRPLVMHRIHTLLRRIPKSQQRKRGRPKGSPPATPTPTPSSPDARQPVE